MELLDDWFVLEGYIRDRLRSALPSDVHVLVASDLASITESSQPTPAVHVLYRGFRPTTAGPAMAEEIEQFWMTVVAARNVTTLKSAEAVRANAGPLIAGVIAALGRYVPPLPDCKSLHLHPAPDAAYRAGFGYFPIGWRVPMKFRAARSR